MRVCNDLANYVKTLDEDQSSSYGRISFPTSVRLGWGWEVIKCMGLGFVPCFALVVAHIASQDNLQL